MNRRANPVWLSRGGIFLGAIIAAILCAPVVPDGMRSWVCIGVLTVGLPFAFKFTAANKIDRWLGELSYPAYLCHGFLMPIAVVASRKLSGSPESFSLLLFVCVVLFTLVGSVLIYRFVDLPVDRFRQARAQRLLAEAGAPSRAS